jgi:hypothetical protein
LHYYRGFFGVYQGFHSTGLEHFRLAAELDPVFPYYRFHLARELLQRGLPEDDAEAVPLLVRLCEDSILFLEAYELLANLLGGQRPRLATPGTAPWLQDFGADGPPFTPPPETTSELQRLVDDLTPLVDKANEEIDFIDGVAPERNRALLVRADSATPDAQAGIALVELRRLRKRLKDIETSKFWKLRKAWFRLWRALGLGRHE